MNNLKVKLHSRWISQAELSRRLGVSPQRVSNWIRGKNNPNREQMFIISNMLDTSIEELFFSEDLNV
jgi:transcriptional regulator with XRE-family HTH domain